MDILDNCIVKRILDLLVSLHDVVRTGSSNYKPVLVAVQGYNYAPTGTRGQVKVEKQGYTNSACANKNSKLDIERFDSLPY